MKKLMVLALVLGFVGLANAGLSISAPKTDLLPGEVATITVTSDHGNAWLGYLVLADGGVGALADGIAVAAGDLGAAIAYTEAGFGTGFEITTASSTVGGLKPGTQWTFNFSSADAGVANVLMYDDAAGYSAPVSAIAFTVIPEPMTMGLLALGGLFIRRKK